MAMCARPLSAMARRNASEMLPPCDMIPTPEIIITGVAAVVKLGSVAIRFVTLPGGRARLHNGNFRTIRDRLRVTPVPQEAKAGLADTLGAEADRWAERVEAIADGAASAPASMRAPSLMWPLIPLKQS